MTTINVPPTFYESNIIVAAEGFTNGTPYYNLLTIDNLQRIDNFLTIDTYQFIMPVSWNPTITGFSNYTFQCYAVSNNGAIDSSLTEITGIYNRLHDNIFLPYSC